MWNLLLFKLIIISHVTGSQMSRDIKEIKFLLKDMVRSVAFLTSIATGRSNDTTMSDQIPSDFRFPLNSLQELHDLEVLLQDASAVRNLVRFWTFITHQQFDREKNLKFFWLKFLAAKNHFTAKINFNVKRKGTEQGYLCYFM